jgi:uncharacterized protein (TIGR02270 family)
MILLNILEEHFEEADFLFCQRENALRDRAYNLDDLAELEERLLAHLDGLVLGEKEAWHFLVQKLSDGEVGEVFTAAFVATESGNETQIDQVFKVFREATGDPSGIWHALYHTSYPDLEPKMRPFLNDESKAVCAAAIDVLSFRRLSIEPARLQNFLNDPDPNMILSALNAIGRLRLTLMTDAVDRLLEHSVSAVRGRAMQTGFLLKSEKALSACQHAIQNGAEEMGGAMILLGKGGDSQTLPLWVNALDNPQLARDAVTAIGLLGNITAMESLICCCSNPVLSRLACESIQTLTGVDLEKEKLTTPPPVPTNATGATGATEDEEAIAMDPDEALPYPDPEKVASWWKANVSRFDKKVRYRKGQPYSAHVLIDILQTGHLLERHDAALELALINPKFPYGETAAFAMRQKKDWAQIISRIS